MRQSRQDHTSPARTEAESAGGPSNRCRGNGPTTDAANLSSGTSSPVDTRPISNRAGNRVTASNPQAVGDKDAVCGQKVNGTVHCGPSLLGYRPRWMIR
ncbi:hypothetical protein C8D87_103639 [Lentzea atacamensis]|uniref:Uncharacterized protein n=1 Tax=Lentzea atacamensis TaxID=531938 RepID=A0ABX9EAW9_9PSEU|nr:hypothetical protein C8D87_103639 [Lentzea atacamensis]